MSLQIRFKVTENEKYSSFYENYALQASFTLDTKLCDNITADGGTIANVGRKKQITFVSEKNTDVEAVQFVIKTQAIEIPQEKAPQEQAEEALSFWQKLLRLFGLY